MGKSLHRLEFLGWDSSMGFLMNILCTYFHSTLVCSGHLRGTICILKNLLTTLA